MGKRSRRRIGVRKRNPRSAQTASVTITGADQESRTETVAARVHEKEQALAQPPTELGSLKRSLQPIRPIKVQELLNSCLSHAAEVPSLDAVQSYYNHCELLEHHAFFSSPRRYESFMNLMIDVPPRVPGLVEKSMTATSSHLKSRNCARRILEAWLELPGGRSLIYALAQTPRHRLGNFRIFILQLWYLTLETLHSHKDFIGDYDAIISSYVNNDSLALVNFISKDATEPMHIRAMAMLLRAEVAWGRRNTAPSAFTTAEAAYRRRAAVFASAIGPRECIESCRICPEFETRYPEFHYRLSRPSAFLSECLCRSLKRLCELQGPALPWAVGQTRSNLATVCVEHHVGGSGCDYCGKGADELNNLVLSSCRRCRFAHYCSPECQSKAWHSGHKDHCRPFGRFRVGDFAILQRLKDDAAQLNGSRVIVKGNAMGGMCNVLVQGNQGCSVSEEVIVVKKRNLRHPRAAR